MNARISAVLLSVLAVALLPAPPLQAQRSLLENDPDVVYVDEFTDKPIELLTAKPTPVYFTKSGQRRLSVLPPDTKVVLLGMTEKAYRVRSNSSRGGVSGWVSPKLLASKDKDFVENLKKVYERQKKVRELIANNEVAIGMSLEEVSQSLGQPTKTKVRQTAKGRSGQWEFIDFVERDHFVYVRNPQTGVLYRQYSHTTQEERGKIVVEFEEDVVTAIEESENAGARRVKVVVPPIVFGW